MKYIFFILFLILFFKINFSIAETCSPWRCVNPGSFKELGIITNPGPHIICGNDTIPKPNIKGTSVNPGTLRSVCTNIPISPPPFKKERTKDAKDYGNIKYKIFPELLFKYEIFPKFQNSSKNTGEYEYEVSVESYFSTCPKIGPEYIGDFKIIVEKPCKERDRYGFFVEFEKDFSDLAEKIFDGIKGVANANPYLDISGEKASLKVLGELTTVCCNDDGCEDPTTLQGSISVTGSAGFTATLSAFPQPPDITKQIGSYRVQFKFRHGPALDIIPYFEIGGVYTIKDSEKCKEECLTLRGSGEIKVKGKHHIFIEAAISKRKGFNYIEVSKISAKSEASVNTGFSITDISCNFFDCDKPCTKPKICGDGLTVNYIANITVEMWVISIEYEYSGRILLIRPGCF